MLRSREGGDPDKETAVKVILTPVTAFQVEGKNVMDIRAVTVIKKCHTAVWRYAI